MVTASQALKMYELLNKHFKNKEDAQAVVASIEGIVDNKFNDQKERLATKEDIFCLKSDISKLETRMEQGFKDQLKWLIILMVGLSSLAVAVMKLT
jgi:predicted  nucleic acid-binding Zn-ribbon protein